MQYDFHCKMCNSVTFFHCLCRDLMKSMIFIVLSALETVHDTVQYRCCISSLLYRLLRIRQKRQNPLHSYVREEVHCKCTMQCTVYFIITLLNVGNVLLCIIYQLNFTVFMQSPSLVRQPLVGPGLLKKLCPLVSVEGDFLCQVVPGRSVRF